MSVDERIAENQRRQGVIDLGDEDDGVIDITDDTDDDDGGVFLTPPSSAPVPMPPASKAGEGGGGGGGGKKGGGVSRNLATTEGWTRAAASRKSRAGKPKPESSARGLDGAKKTTAVSPCIAVARVPGSLLSHYCCGVRVDV